MPASEPASASCFWRIALRTNDRHPGAVWQTVRLPAKLEADWTLSGASRNQSGVALLTGIHSDVRQR
jgi:hypothetical protein